MDEVRAEEKRLLSEIEQYQKSESDRVLSLSTELEDYSIKCSQLAPTLERLLKKTSIYHLITNFSSYLNQSQQLADQEITKQLDLNIKHLLPDGIVAISVLYKSNHADEFDAAGTFELKISQ